MQHPCKTEFYLTFLIGIQQHSGRQARAAGGSLCSGVIAAGKALQHFHNPAEAQTANRAADNAHSIKNESPVFPPLPNGNEKIILVLRKEIESS